MTLPGVRSPSQRGRDEGACPRCRERGKTWNGDDPRCAFPDGGRFVTRNWCCATMGRLREMAYPESTDPIPGVWAWTNEQSGGLIPYDGGFIVLSWYKRRGRTEGAWFMYEDTVSPLTLEVAEDFIANAAGGNYQHAERS